MKGVIFNLLEDVVSEEHGEAAWEDAVATAQVEGSYTSIGTYPHAELVALVLALCEQTGAEPDDLVTWFGSRALAKLAVAYPELFERHESTVPFLLTLNDIIHPEVRKLYPGADVPEFDYRLVESDRVLMGYHSKRGLCALGEGLIQGAANHYGEQVSVAQPSCTKRGDDECVFEVVISR